MPVRPPLNLSIRTLHADAVTARVLACTHHEMEHALRNQFQSLRSGMELLARAMQPRAKTTIDPLQCLDLLKGHLARVEVAVAELLALSAVESQPAAVVGLAGVMNDVIEGLPPSDQAFVAMEMNADLLVTTPPTTLRRCMQALLLEAADLLPPGGSMEIRLGPGKPDAILLELRMTPAIPDGALDRLAEACVIVREALSGSLTGIEVATDGATTSLRCTFKETAIPTIGTDEGKGSRILVVDADKDAADSLAMVLELEGFDASAAYSGDEARYLAGRERFDAVVINPMLPDMGGNQLAEEIRTATPAPLLIAVIDRVRTSRNPNDSTMTAFDHLIPRTADLGVLRDLLAGIARTPADR